jgi:hypothetical protein
LLMYRTVVKLPLWQGATKGRTEAIRLAMNAMSTQRTP